MAPHLIIMVGILIWFLGFVVGLFMGWAIGSEEAKTSFDPEPFNRHPYGPMGVRKHRQDVGSEEDVE